MFLSPPKVSEINPQKRGTGVGFALFVVVRLSGGGIAVSAIEKCGLHGVYGNCQHHFATNADNIRRSALLKDKRLCYKKLPQTH